MKIRILVAFVLAVLTAALAPAQIFAASKPVYISDVMVGMGETAEEAKAALTSEGYTVLDRNLNEGAGSAFKTDKFVYIGYKTTADPDEAITDLAVMNMNGGYSFTDYEVLMNKYRDSQIRPFINKFMAAIKEYRVNYESDIPGNKAKADFAYSILSHIKEDDSGSNMGDLLLKPTKEELGMTDAEYKALPKEEKSQIVDLTTAIMQGNTQVVYLMEQMLAISTDTSETTWLERLSDLGPDGLDVKYAEAGVRPTEANREMAALYSDTVKTILAGWVDFRAELLEFDMEFKSSSGGETGEVEDVDFSQLVNYDVPEVESTGEKPDLEQASEEVDSLVDSMASMMSSGEQLYSETEGSDIAGIYGIITSLPYGDGTLFDFFTLEYSEVSGDNISALYPLASTLTEGQTAALDLLPLRLLVQIGATVTDAFEQFSPENSNMFEGLDFIGGISIYLDVNRELFSDKVAFTSEALRKGLDKENGWMTPDQDLLGLSRLTTLSWAVSGFFGALTLVSVLKTVTLDAQYKLASDQSWEITKSVTNFFDNCNDISGSSSKLYDMSRISIVKDARPGFTKVVFECDEILEGSDYVMGTETMERYYDSSYTFQDGYDSIQELEDEYEKVKMSKDKALGRWGTMEVVFGVVFAVITLVSIGLTIYDLYRYYNVNYAPIPKYIVDGKDITATDENGNQIVVRNDSAYFTVAPTNRPDTAENHESLKDYADLNGDAGKEWLALYYAKQDGGEPILADSFKVVTGSISIPDGYSTGIHSFGSKAAANLTDSRYTYNDDLGGIYVYFKTQPTAAPSTTASVFSGGTIALVGVGGALVGAAIGASAVTLIKRKKEPQPA